MSPVARPRTTGTSRRAAEAGAATVNIARLHYEIGRGKLGANFMVRFKEEVAKGFKPSVFGTLRIWNKLAPEEVAQVMDACGRDLQDLRDWNYAVAHDRLLHDYKYISAMCDSLVRVPPAFNATDAPFKKEPAADLHDKFKRAQIKIERNRALAQVAAFSQALPGDGDGAIRARVAGFLV